MSKAFTKESDSGDEDSGSEIQDLLPPSSKNYMTPGGADVLLGELRTLANGERPKLLEVIAWAAGNGDRSENADYQYGKRRLREIDRRLRYLTKRVDQLQVIDPAQQQGEKVLFGATVTVEADDGKQTIYRIVGVDETDPSRGKISWVSPIGKALLQSGKGDLVTIRTPGGEIELEVVNVEFKAID